MFWRVIAALCSLTFLFGGCGILLDDNCASVDFGGSGRSRTYTCYRYEHQGEMSASAAGGLMLLGGVALMTLAAWPLIRLARRNRRARRLGLDDLYVPPAPGYSPPTSQGRAGDADGLIVAMSIAAVLRHVAVQEGVGSAGWEHAKRLIVVASDSSLSMIDAEHMLLSARYHDLEPSYLPEELKWVLVRSTLEIAIADGVLTDDEEAAIVSVIRDLWGQSEEVARLTFVTLIDVLSSDHDPKKAAALETLGLGDDATTADIREAYLALVRQHHPDLASPDARTDATAKTAEINAAYEYLIGVTAT